MPARTRNSSFSFHDKATIVLEDNDAVVGRWAAVMLNTRVYAEVIDRYGPGITVAGHPREEP